MQSPPVANRWAVELSEIVAPYKLDAKQQGEDAMTIWRASLAAPLLIAAVLAAQAAGPFDGNWKGDWTRFGGSTRVFSCANGDLSFAVADSKLRGEITNTAGRTFPLNGTVEADGAFRGKIGRNTDVAGKFTGNAFQASWHFANCDYQGTAKRL
jgi:hypothetical protein